MKIEHYVVGMVGTNCYFAINEHTKECLIIDPGDEAAKLSEKLTAGGYKPVAILLTHAHFDHIMGVDALAGKYNIPVYIHEDDADMLQRPELNCGAMIGTKATAKADKLVHGDPCDPYTRTYDRRRVLLFPAGGSRIFGRHTVLRIRRTDRPAGWQYVADCAFREGKAVQAAGSDDCLSGTWGTDQDQHRKTIQSVYIRL